MTFPIWCFCGLMGFIIGELISGIRHGRPRVAKSMEELIEKYPMFAETFNNSIKYYIWFTISTLIGAIMFCLLGPLSIIPIYGYMKCKKDE